MISKIHYQDDQPELMRLGNMVQVFAPGDLVKRAASELFPASELAKYAPDKNHFMIHLVGMGDGETYGYNKNGDFWPKVACETRHHTFVTHGTFFREHRNRDAKKEGIGLMKASGFHPQLRRVETLVWGDIKKAEEEYEMAKAGKSLSFSMSARVPFDKCSCCHHKAKKVEDYCDHLKYDMLQYLPEFEKYAYAINDHPTFFDMSRVRRPADRIAHFLEYRFHDNELQKAAAAGRVITGAAWAEYEGVCLPPGYEREDEESLPMAKQAMLRDLAAEEQWLEDSGRAGAAGSEKSAFSKEIAPRAFEGQLTSAQLEKFSTLRTGTLFHELAKRAAVLPFISFAAYIKGITAEEAAADPVVKRAAYAHLPNLFRDLEKSASGELSSLFDADPACACATDTENDDKVQDFMDDVEDRFSCQSGPVKQRVIRITITLGINQAPEMDKAASEASASVDNEAKALAHSYGHYKLSALLDMERLTGEEITEPTKLLVTAQNRLVYR